jgi:hypothetical protein
MVLVCRHKPITRTDMYSNLPLTTIHCSSFVIHYYLFNVPYSAFSKPYSIFFIRYSVSTTHDSRLTTNSFIKIWIVNFEILNMKSGHWVFCWQTECIEMTFLNLASIHPAIKKRVTQPPIHHCYSDREAFFASTRNLSIPCKAIAAMRNLFKWCYFLFKL